MFIATYKVPSTARPAIQLLFDMSANALEIKAVQILKCIVRCAVDCTITTALVFSLFILFEFYGTQKQYKRRT
jgi:hypothetical protein